MAENQDGTEKTEDATPKKIQQSRDKGQVARSKELTTMLMMMASAIAFIVIGDNFVIGLSEIMIKAFSFDRKAIFDDTMMVQYLALAIEQAFWVVLPLITILVLIAIISPMVLSGFVFSTQALAPKLEKLDPIKGMKKLFAMRGLMELLKALLKFLVIGAMGYFLVWVNAERLLNLGNQHAIEAMAHSAEIIAWAFLFLSLVLILFALIDVPFQLWDHAKQLKMTKQEVKDEMKQSDGNPEMKGRRRMMQRELAMQRMMSSVPQADVIVTNPTHFAVALKYNPDTMRAPVIVAMGADFIASQIRSVAASHQIPLLSAPALARALYYNGDIDNEIPDGLFLAVAQVLAYIYQLKQGGSSVLAGVDHWKSLPIPDELRHD